MQVFPSLLLVLFIAAAAPAPAADDLAYGAAPDYQELDGVLLRNVKQGFVDYDGIEADPAFRRFITTLGDTNPADLGKREEQLAYLINAYNVLAIQAVIEGYQPSDRRAHDRTFGEHEFRVLRSPMTLDGLEQERLEPLAEPRVHFALVCASLACPRLSNRAYRPEDVDDQLDAAAHDFINDATRNRFDADRRLAFLSPVFDIHEPAFSRQGGSLQRYLAAYARDPAVAELLAADAFEIRYLEPDHILNGIRRRAADDSRGVR